MFAPIHKRLLAIGGVLGIIITLIILWKCDGHDESEKINRNRRKAGWISTIQDGMLKHPCKTTDSNQDKTSELYFCYQNNKTQAVFTFDQSLTVGGRKMIDWDGYDWYLDGGGKLMTGHDLEYAHWWGDVFTTTGSWGGGSYGYSQISSKWKKQVSLTKTKGNLVLNINTTQTPFGKPANFGPYKNPPCHGLRLCVWREHAKDPCVTLLLCPNITTTPVSSTTEPDITLGPKSTSTVKPKIYIQPDTDDWFEITTGISRIDNNWLLMVEQAAEKAKTDCVVCMGARPLLQVVPSALEFQCLVNVMNNTIPSTNCTHWDSVFPLTNDEKQKPYFSSKVAAGIFSCVNRTGTGKKQGKLNATQCYQVQTVDIYFRPESRSDIWWWCGDDKLYDKLPYNTTGTCASVSLILPVTVLPTALTELLTSVNSVLPEAWNSRHKRSWYNKNDPTYIDSIGVPRGVPDEYKLVNQVAAGFESTLCWWCTINKNVDRINYIHYNVQTLGNKTEEGFLAVHGQLSATSLMSFQNRIAVDMLLAEKGGVCSIFGDQCCTFIPNNTAANGSLTRAIEGLRSLNKKMKDHSGVDTTMWDGFGDAFGKYKQLAATIIMSIAVFAAILTLCGCCCIPCIRVLCTRLITTALEPVNAKVSMLYTLLPSSEQDDDDVNETNVDEGNDNDDESLNFPDLFPDPGNYDGIL
ncbi:hypothetical protein ACEWY4_004551 [Coilia grayii]|uniref:Envelope protein n=1 Tax=Coilia grayii TaxID=363190 RepID=A0ABD1KLZ9_9TELE